MGIVSDLGEVLDMSKAGMRLKSGNSKLSNGDVLGVTIRNHEHKLAITARVAWVKKTGWKSREIGLQFLDVSPAVAIVLGELAKYGFVDPDRVAKEKAAAGSSKPRSGASAIRASVEIENLYAALGVPQTATQQDIQAAYRKLARELHPDVCREAGASEKFSFVSKAYSVLRDTEKRARYDEMIAGAVKTSNAA